MNTRRIAAVAAVAVGLAAAGYWWAQGRQVGTASGAPLVRVVVPSSLTAIAEGGMIAFQANCAECHGSSGSGQDGIAPPLVHKIYEPNHHGDIAFTLAVRHGVRAHHWRFGDMPPIEGVDDESIAEITAYIRELQRANGIN
jgi:mono/diheme cytochrome c family protein